MENNEFHAISLCKIEDPPFQSKEPEPFRIADLNDRTQAFEGFVVDEEQEKIFSNRDWLFLDKNGGPQDIGEYGVWAWNATPNLSNAEKDYVKMTFRHDLHPILFVEIENVTSVESLVKSIAIRREDLCSDRIFIGFLKGDGDYKGVLCEREDFEIKNEDAVLSKSVFSLPIFEISDREIMEFMSGRKFFRTLTPGKFIEEIVVQEPAEIIRKLFLERTVWNAFKERDLTKQEWKKCKAVLEDIATQNIIEEFRNIYKCSDQEAEEAFKDFLDNIEKHIDVEDFDSKFVGWVCKLHQDLYAEVSKACEEKWRRENRETIREAEREIERIKKELDLKKVDLKEKEEKHTAFIETKKKELADLNKEEEAVKDYLKNRERFAADVEEKVKCRIQAAQENAAEFIAQCAFIPAGGEKIQKEKHLSGIQEGQKFQDAEIVDDKIIFEEILENALSCSGVSESWREVMSILLMCAADNHFPVLLAGTGADAIVHAWSVATQGRLATVFDCERASDSDYDRLKEGEGKVYLIRMPFYPYALDKLIPIIDKGENEYFLTIPFAEELCMEPSSLFTHALPILTDLVVDKHAVELEEGCLYTGNRPFTKKVTKSKEIFGKTDYKKLKMSPVLMDRITYLFQRIQGIEGNKRSEYFLLMSYAAALNKKEEFAEIVEDKHVPKKIKAIMNEWTDEDAY